jgi:UDP-N-acetylglucosamine diphosphorylase / glucose-1-phosphate thymidylyltransferase / UDP-N-acetylgalactosamine diphosphorylase / glucosamine-1-phosphate N-acetyltransferase / galactosamine-1-phosphate N-acetyltransferase
MLKIILTAPHIIKPFNERARDLRIQNQPLWLHQRNVLAPYVTSERELEAGKTPATGAGTSPCLPR